MILFENNIKHQRLSLLLFHYFPTSPNTTKMTCSFLNSITLTSIFLVFLNSCNESSPVIYTNYKGETMGTFYNIQFEMDSDAILQSEIDSLLKIFNLSLSTYIPESTISRFNQSDSVYCYASKDTFFEKVFTKSKVIYGLSKGYFNPTIMPLVNYYGFGYEKSKKVEIPDTNYIKEVLGYMRFEEIYLKADTLSGEICIYKKHKPAQLDFSAIAKGYGVDVVAYYLESKGASNYMVEIGGEVRTKGENAKKKPWVIGINKPSDDASLQEVELLLSVSGVSVATSGNYRNFYESKGQKYAHIIDPLTGINRPSDILSTTVITTDCMSADGFATAFMAMGLDKSLELANNIEGLEACFIYDEEGDGQFEFRMTEGFKKYFLVKDNQ